jgi:hypothetical protein
MSQHQRAAAIVEAERDAEQLARWGAPIDHAEAFPTACQRVLAALLGVNAEATAEAVLAAEEAHAPASLIQRDRRFVIAAFDAAAEAVRTLDDPRRPVLLWSRG